MTILHGVVLTVSQPIAKITNNLAKNCQQKAVLRRLSTKLFTYNSLMFHDAYLKEAFKKSNSITRDKN